MMSLPAKKSFLALLLSSLLFGLPSTAMGADLGKTEKSMQVVLSSEEDSWDDAWEEESPWLVSGSISQSIGQRFSKDSLLDSKNTLDETRLRLNLDAEGSSDKATFRFAAKIDGWHDNLLETTDAEFRELQITVAYPLFNADSSTIITAGRQAITWGTGDLVFLNDNFSKDWVSFFSGREDEYLKAPIDALRVNHEFSWFGLDAVWSPEHRPDRSISGERFSYFFPLLGMNTIESPAPVRNTDDEWALRLYKNIGGTEYALYYFDGADKQARDVNVLGQPVFSEKKVMGASVRGTLWGGVYALEIAQHQGADSVGDNPLKANNQWRYLVSYEHEVVSNLNLAVQYYVEKTEDYSRLINGSPFPEFEPEELRELLTTRWSYQADKGKWLWSLFVFYSPSDHDSYMRPQVTYRPNDEWQFQFGANKFSGRDKHSFFGQFEKASNWYLSAKYQF